MHAKFVNLTALVVLLICHLTSCLAAESSDPNESSKYLGAVRTFADNVLKYGRDTYGPKHTPLTPQTRAMQKSTLKVVKVDSEETDGKGVYAVDSNPNTIWHTQWRSASPAHPHEIILQLDPPCKIKGLSYLPRQEMGDNVGTIEGYEIYVSTDGKDFGQPVKRGEFFPYGKDKRTVLFDPKQCGFVKLVALSEVNGQVWTSAAEIGVIRESEQVALDEIVIRSGLALAAPLPLSRADGVIRRDPLEAQLLAGIFATPKEGAVPFPAADANDIKPARAWTAVTANANGVFKGHYYTAFAGGGWFYATVESSTERTMLLEAYGHRSFFLNGEPRGGNEVSYPFVRIPVKLKAGANEFLFSIGQRQFAAKLVPTPAAVFISDRDIIAPSLVARRDTDGPMGVLVVNASVRPLSDARIRIASDLPEKDAWVDLGVMPELTAKKTALPARFTSTTAGTAGSTHPAHVILAASDGTVLDTLSVDLTTVSSTEPRVVTRISTIDGSAQYYALVPSSANSEDGDPIPGILFSLHGANNEASEAAGDIAPKKEAHVVCPTNRRPVGFLWEDWGCIDFTEAVAHARANLVNDPRRSWLTGHSMGGHGTWLLGARFPDEFAAIAPTAAYINDFNPRRATSADTAPSEDPAEAMLLRAGHANHILSIKENYLQQGIYVLHGDADEDVPVSYAREMFKQLAAISHPDFQYYERPGSPHWWSTAHDWPPKLQFLFQHVLPEPEDITHVRFRTWVPQVSHRSAWVRVLQQDKPFEVSSVDVSMDAAKRTITGTTSNVTTLELVPPIALPAVGQTTDITITLDGQSVTMTSKADTPHLRFRRRQGSNDKVIWMLDPSCRDGSKPAPMPASEKTPARGGPFKAAFANGFIVVVGTQGDKATDALLMSKIRYDSDQWWVRANGCFEIISDTAFDPKQYLTRNVILYGNHDQNAAWSMVLGDVSPVDVHNGVFIGPTSHHHGDDIMVLFVYPRADCDQGQVGVVAATGAKGMRAAMRTSVFPRRTGIPDLVAFRAAMLTDGASGVIEAGFFGNDWSVERGTWIRR
jgi:poly(3-hydroxybutyrate) depolymerase